jgi:hypothetical protein
MKRAGTLLIAALSLLPLALPASPAPSAAETAAAKAVLMRYFEAMSGGDVRTMRRLMGGDLLAKRSPLLGNPTFPAYLQQTYGGAEFSIDKVERLGPADVGIEAEITVNDETLARRFLLRKDRKGAFFIYGETDPDLDRRPSQ